MLKRLWTWTNERWPVSPVIRALLLVEEVPGGASYFFSFGYAVLFVFTIQALTGVFQLFFYVPTVDHAYASLAFLRTEVPFGWLIHNLHYWGATAMVVLILLHVTQVFLWGAYKDPRQLTWLLGSFLFLLTLGMMFTGSPLPWDEKGYWATEVGTSIAGMAPLVGDLAKRLLRGGEEMGQLTLSRFFVLHVVLLAGLLASFIGLHLVSFRRAGTAGPWDAAKRTRFGPFWPDQAAKDTVVACFILVALVALAAFVPPPFTGAADPMDQTFTPKPEWTFLFLYQALKYFPGSLEAAAAVGLPLVLILIVLAVPFIDRKKERNPAKRPLAVGLFFAGLAVAVILSIAGAMSRMGAEQAGGAAGPIPAAGTAAEVSPPARDHASSGAAQPGPSGMTGNPDLAAARIIGNAGHGGRLFAQNCARCHGPAGREGVPNPGSEDGRVPVLQPLDRELFAPDPDDFVSKIDPLLQHGSAPAGAHPALTMPNFGDSGALTQPQIAHLEAYVLGLNGVRRDRISHPGIRPGLFFVLLAAVFGLSALALAVAGIKLRRTGER